jgi:hypothetical protein
MDHVFYERSSDGGQTWVIMNDGKPIDGFNGKSPSIDYYYGYERTLIAYQERDATTGNAVIKVACFRSGQLQFTSEVYENPFGGVDYYSVDYKPVIGYASNDQVMVAWEAGDIEYTIGTISFSSETITWNVFGSFWDYTFFYYPTIAAYKTTPGTPAFHLAWQNNYSSIKYCSLTFQTIENYSISSVEQVSTGCGFPVNFSPSINVSNSGNISLVWIGTPYYGSSYRKTISRTYDGRWSTSFGQYGNNVLSPTSAFYSSGSIIAWSENPSGTTYTNKFLKYGSVKTASTTGKDMQVYSADQLQQMKINSFSSVSLPYAFNQSADLYSINKSNSPVMASGVQAVAFKDTIEFFFRIGDIEFNGETIDFPEFEDPDGELTLNELNQYLLSNSFSPTGTDNLIYSIEFGATDSLAALSLLGNNKSVSFKVDLIDRGNGEVITTLYEIIIDADNISLLHSNTYNYEFSGITCDLVSIRVQAANNIEPQYAAAVIKSDESVLLKGNTIKINLADFTPVTEYALEQNYPNPFNPSTTIKYQVPKDGLVTLKIYDALGKEVITLVEEMKTSGRYEVNFSAIGGASSLASGVYLYRLKANDFVDVKKMILLK